MGEMAVKLDSIEQREFINDVQIVGVEESSSEEEDKKKVLKLAKEKMDVKLKKTDIIAMHRLGRKSSEKTTCRDLVVSFKEATTRETFYNNRKKTATSKLPNQNIYINDRLTNHRKGVFYAARKLYKARKIFAAWTQRGNVLVRVHEQGSITQINDYRDLQKIKETQLGISDSYTQDSSLQSASTSEIRSHLSDYDYYVEA